MIEIFASDFRQTDYLVVAFTGVRHGLNGIPFEFYKTLGAIECSALFVRDTKQRWYQYDHDEIARVRDALVAAAQKAKAKRIVCLGNSMGGFGALLFGGMINADGILAFAPQSCIAPGPFDAIADTRYSQWRRNIPHFPFGDLLDMPPPAGHVAICYGAEDPLDAAHARRILSAWRGQEIRVEGRGHDAIVGLKERGELIPLIRSMIEFPRSPPFESERPSF